MGRGSREKEQRAEAGSESCETRTLRAGADGARRNTAGRRHGSCAEADHSSHLLRVLEALSHDADALWPSTDPDAGWYIVYEVPIPLRTGRPRIVLRVLRVLRARSTIRG